MDAQSPQLAETAAATVPEIARLSAVSVTLAGNAGPVDVLRDIDLSIAAGSANAIVGPSGSGKTTLLMVIAGLERATSGRVVVDGLDISDLGEDALAAVRRDSVGIVFQSFHLLSTMTALENVAIPLEFKGLPDARARARRQLERAGLGHRLDHYPGELSGGEQQRVAIARVLAAGVKLILADEPTGNLDQETGREIMDLLFDLNREERTTLLLVTHDRELARRCGRIIAIRDGRIVPAGAQAP
jgi:putative ABC transport system ATP-binding protein